MSKICGAKLPNGKFCQKKPIEGKKRCAQHGGLSTGPKTPEGKEKAMRLKTGTQYSFLLKCSICPPNIQCQHHDNKREFCPLEAEILNDPVNVQAIREARIKSNLIIIGRCERIFGRKGNVTILSHIEKLDDQLDDYLKAYEKVAPSTGESLVEKLARERKKLEEEEKGKKLEKSKRIFEVSKDYVSRDISEAFVKARIFQDVFEGKGWLRGAYNHEREIAFYYIDEIIR